MVTRGLWRLLGFFALAGAFCVVAVDVAHSVLARRIMLTDAGRLASGLAPGALANAPRWLDAALGALPAALVLALAAAAALRLARAPRARIGERGR
ncbi:hypothetical protein [Methylocella sp.]|uniref:hypothetical protein n=1 Tax=Methylocella sp. TaxID=1978226 RepID=UPI003784925E